MRLKYFTRGLGVGFIIAGLIFIICFAFYRPTLSEDEIRLEAMKLGMVEPSEVNATISEEEEETEETEVDVSDALETASEELDAEDSDEEETSQSQESDDVNMEYDGEVTVTEVDPADVHDATRGQTAEYVTVSVASGESSYAVGQNLYRQGLVDDASDFDTYLEDQNLDSYLQPGTYTIEKGSSYAEIAKILTSK